MKCSSTNTRDPSRVSTRQLSSTTFIKSADINSYPTVIVLQSVHLGVDVDIVHPCVLSYFLLNLLFQKHLLEETNLCLGIHERKAFSTNSLFSSTVPDEHGGSVSRAVALLPPPLPPGVHCASGGVDAMHTCCLMERLAALPQARRNMFTACLHSSADATACADLPRRATTTTKTLSAASPTEAADLCRQSSRRSVAFLSMALVSWVLRAAMAVHQRTAAAVPAKGPAHLERHRVTQQGRGRLFVPDRRPNTPRKRNRVASAHWDRLGRAAPRLQLPSACRPIACICPAPLS